MVYDVYEYDDDYVDQYGNTYNHSEVPQFQPAGRRYCLVAINFAEQCGVRNTVYTLLQLLC